MGGGGAGSFQENIPDKNSAKPEKVYPPLVIFQPKCSKTGCEQNDFNFNKTPNNYSILISRKMLLF
jgi:hypothetical protein